jgi:hypothetical protein
MAKKPKAEKKEAAPELTPLEGETPVERVRKGTTAVRLQFTWMTTSRAVREDQKEQAAEVFEANKAFVRMSKDLWNSHHPAIKAVNAIKSQAQAYFKSVSLPWPEKATRLVRRDQLAHVVQSLDAYSNSLKAAVAKADEAYAEIKAEAREQLSDLYDEAQYPTSLIGVFQMHWDYPAVMSVDQFIREAQPEMYEAQMRRIEARLGATIDLAEQAFMKEFTDLVKHLTEKVTSGNTFRSTAVTNLTEFFDRFKLLNVNSNPTLDALVERAKNIVKGVSAEDLRNKSDLRNNVGAQMAHLTADLDAMLVQKPTRVITSVKKKAPDAQPVSQPDASPAAEASPQAAAAASAA